MLPETPMVREVVATGEPVDLEWVGRGADGEAFPTEVRLRPLALQAAGGPRVLALVRDMRQLKRAERERGDAERLTALSALAGGIAHDFNNMLTGIVCNLGLARAEPEPDEREQALCEAQQVAMNAAALTRELMTFARGAPPQRTVLDVVELVESTARFSLRGSAVRLDFQPEGDIWPVAGDEAQLTTVVQNVVLNAIHAIDGSGVLTVAIHNVPSWQRAGAATLCEAVSVLVTDSGPGIPDELVGRVFEPWVSSKAVGRGLGLASAHSIARRHGGELAASNRAEGGACFSLILPRTHEQRVPESSATRSGPRGVARVLVMDDQRPIRVSVVRALRTAGYEATAAADGSLAVSEFKRAAAAGEPYHIALVDMTVPGGMGGRQTLAALRELDEALPVVAMSGHTESSTHGFDAFIAKPFGPQDVLRTIGEILDLTPHR